MGEKVRVGVKTEDGSYVYHYDRSSSLGGKERKNLITGQKNNSYPKKKLSVINRKSGSEKAEKKKMPKARDMAMGNKNIVYLGDPFMVDGKMFDPVKADPETYLRPKDAKTYSMGGGMDMGKKKKYAKKNEEKLFGIEITDEPQAGYTVKETKNLSIGGDVTVTKGGDYIKDLID